MVPVRSDLLTGGARVLYLGWLLRVQAGDVARGRDGARGSCWARSLVREEAALVEFLRIDDHLIAAAVQRRKGRQAKARTAGELLAIAKTRREEAEQRAAQKVQREYEKRAAAEAVVRARHLHSLAAREGRRVAGSGGSGGEPKAGSLRPSRGSPPRST